MGEASTETVASCVVSQTTSCPQLICKWQHWLCPIHADVHYPSNYSTNTNSNLSANTNSNCYPNTNPCNHEFLPTSTPFAISMFLPVPSEKNGTLISWMFYGLSELDLLCSVFYVSSLIFGSFVFQEWCFHLVSCHEKLGLPINLEPPTGTLAGILSYCLPPSLWLPLPACCLLLGLPHPT